MGVIPSLDELEDGSARLVVVVEVRAVEQLAFEGAKKLSAMALSKQSPTEPIDGTTPHRRQRSPKAKEVDWQPWSQWGMTESGRRCSTAMSSASSTSSVRRCPAIAQPVPAKAGIRG